MNNLSQLAGINLFRTITNITTAAKNATSHRNNCSQMANHVRMIGNLLNKLKELSGTDLMNFPATGEPLDRLEESLRTALELVESCTDKSYLYMVAMGWSVVYQFRTVQVEIDRCLMLVPLISLIHQYRIQEGLKAIEEDSGGYSLDEEDMEAQDVILKRDRTKKDSKVLEKSLSRRYPDMGLKDALHVEKEKLNIELQQSRVDNDLEKCSVIEHLLEVTEHVVNVPESKLIINAHTYGRNSNRSGHETTANSNSGDARLNPENQVQTEWQADVFGCCREPCLSFVSCIYPCGTFSWIANVVTKGEMSRDQAIHNVMSYSIFCGCCCYTSSVRRKLRKSYNIEGGSCDDFLTHLMCCCCAMVQEWRELELRGCEGCQERKMIPPPFQHMKS